MGNTTIKVLPRFGIKRMERTDILEDQCQSPSCTHVKYKSANFCYHHGGNTGETKNQKAASHSYKLQTYQARLDVLAYDPNIKNLRGEIGILRMLITTRLDQCKDDYDLLLQSAAIATLVTQANALVTSCHRIETLTGHVLDKQEITEFAAKVIKIITEEAPESVANAVAERILDEC